MHNPSPYEINIDEASINIKTLLQNEIDKCAISFGNYEVAKCMIITDLKKTIVHRKKNKIIKKLKKRFGEGGDEEEDEDEEEEEKVQVPF